MLTLLTSLAVGEDLSQTRAVALALASHPVVEAQGERVAAAEGARLQANLKPNFTLYLQSENTRFWGQPKFNYADASDNWIYLGQTIQTAHKRERREALARTQVERARLDRDLTTRQIALRVSHAYWAAAGATRLTALAHEQAAGFQELVDNNRARVKEGVLPGVDLIRSEVELRRLQAAAVQMQLDVVRTRVALFREMAVEDGGARLSDSLEARRDFATTSIDQVEKRIEWRQAEQNVRIGGANIQLQQAQARPDPMLLYGYKRTFGFDTLLGGMIVDLPFRNRNQGGIAAAIAEQRAAQSQQRAWRVQLEADLNTAINDTAARRKLLDETLLPAQRDTEEVLGLVRRAYLEGGIDLLRLIDAERIYFETRMQVVRTQTELRQAEASLAFALGEEP